jgi:uroporphyrinogen decarboxylase
MANVYAELSINLQEILFSREGYPDGLFYYEDLGFKERPFMSPAIYRELLQPAHVKTIRFAHGKNMPVILHCCGFVEPLLPYMIEAGIDCLQAIEIKAGMDLLRINAAYGEKISFMGGIDVRALCSNDCRKIDRELETIIPVIMKNRGYILHTDHSLPPTVEYNTYKYFITIFYNIFILE